MLRGKTVESGGGRRLQNKGFLVACGDRGDLVGDLIAGDRRRRVVTCGDLRPHQRKSRLAHFPTGFMGVHERLGIGPPAVTGDHI